LVGRLEGNKPLGRPNYRREDNIHHPIFFFNLKQHSGDWILPPPSINRPTQSGSTDTASPYHQKVLNKNWTGSDVKKSIIVYLDEVYKGVYLTVGAAGGRDSSLLTG
jgi:hypothetical protein